MASSIRPHVAWILLVGACSSSAAPSAPDPIASPDASAAAADAATSGVRVPRSSAGFSSYYEEVTWAWCLDVAVINRSSLPGVGGPGASERDGYYELLPELCRCAVAGRAVEFNGFFAKDTSLEAMFREGAEGLPQVVVVPTDFATLYSQHLEACRDRVDVAALQTFVYGAGHTPSCVSDATGATGRYYGLNALLEALYTIRTTRLAGGNMEPYPDRREDHCVGRGKAEYRCDDAGYVSATITPCEYGCENATCCTGPCGPEPPPSTGSRTVGRSAPVLTGPVCATPPAACPAASGAEGALPALTLPTCTGEPLALADAVCGGTAAVIYYASEWCPICLQHIPVLMDMYRTELAAAGVRLLFVVGKGPLLQPPTKASCAAFAERYAVDGPSTVYDPTGSFLQATGGGSGGGFFLVLDGGAVVTLAGEGGSLGALTDTLNSLLVTGCAGK